MSEEIISYALSRCYDSLTGGALKRGRNPRFPYVPVVYHPAATEGRGHRRAWQEQIKARAFPTRDEAVAYANKKIRFWRDCFEKKLRDPRWSALHRQWEDEFAKASTSNG